MWAGQGGSAAGRFRNAQTAHVKAAKAAAINKPGNDFMGWTNVGPSHHTRLHGATMVYHQHGNWQLNANCQFAATSFPGNVK